MWEIYMEVKKEMAMTKSMVVTAPTVRDVADEMLMVTFWPSEQCRPMVQMKYWGSVEFRV